MSHHAQQFLVLVVLGLELEALSLPGKKFSHLSHASSLNIMHF
jgi:hypothetical protein